MASDIFLSVDGIPGESTDDQFKGKIEISTYQEHVKMTTTKASTGGSDASGRADVGVLVVHKGLDSSSPLLRGALCKATEIANVVLTLRRTVKEKPTPYMEYKLKQAKVVDLQLTGIGAGSIPNEQVTFRFDEIEYVYTKTGADKGKTQFKYSAAQNKAL